MILVKVTCIFKKPSKTIVIRLGFVLPHPLYLTDVVPSSFHLVRPLQNSLNEETIKWLTTKTALTTVFMIKGRLFQEKEIPKLPHVFYVFVYTLIPHGLLGHSNTHTLIKWYEFYNFLLPFLLKVILKFVNFFLIRYLV